MFKLRSIGYAVGFVTGGVAVVAVVAVVGLAFAGIIASSVFAMQTSQAEMVDVVKSTPDTDPYPPLDKHRLRAMWNRSATPSFVWQAGEDGPPSPPVLGGGPLAHLQYWRSIQNFVSDARRVGDLGWAIRSDSFRTYIASPNGLQFVRDFILHDRETAAELENGELEEIEGLIRRLEDRK